MHKRKRRGGIIRTQCKGTVKIMYERYAELLRRHNVTSYQVAKAVGVSATTFSDWKKGKSTPKIEKLRRVAEYFNVPITYFVDNEELSIDEMIKKSDNISYIMEVGGMNRVPVIGEVHAGMPTITNEVVEGYELCEGDTEDCYYLRVEGDSMIGAGIMPGSLVLIHRQSYAENNQIVVCMIDEESATLKRFRIDGGKVYLTPENPGYKPICMELSDFVTGRAHILGVATEVKIKLK